MTEPENPSPAPALGSLAQSSRLGELKAARWILIILGIINVGFHIYLYTELISEIEKITNSGRIVIESAVAQQRLLIGLGFAIGLIFVVCGFLVYKYPVPATLTGLIVYLAIQAAGAMVEPKTLAQGIILKVVIILCLVKAVQAAFAYKKEADQNRMAGLAT